MHRSLFITLFFLLLTATACGPVIDPEQTRICRLILPILHTGSSEIDVAATNTDTKAIGGLGNGVRIDYLTKTPYGRFAAHYAICLFNETGITARKRELLGVITEDGHLPDASVFFLRRYYLEDAETAQLLPGPGTVELARLPRVPEWLAIAMQHGFALLPLTGVYALMAASYALIYGLIGRINLAFGAFATLGGLSAGIVIIAIQTSGISSLPVMLLAGGLIALATCASWGEALANLVFQPLMRQSGSASASSAHGQPILIATAGLLIALPEMIQLAQNSFWLKPILASPEIIATTDRFFVTATPISLIVFAASMVIALGLLVLMKYSRFGRAWRATADDPLVASLFGISSALVLARTVMLACALAGFAGYIFSVQYGNIGYSDGKLLGLKALVAAVAGGIGSLPGAMLGGVCLGVLEALWSANLPIEYREVAIFTALVALLTLRPGGFFGFGDLTPRRV